MHVIDYGEMYHLYIFDIEMPEMNGLQLAKEIRKIDAKALFVFLTGYTQYVMDVFEVITFDYISKPITVEKLESVLLKAMQYLHIIKRDFVFQFRKNQFRISCDDIVYSGGNAFRLREVRQRVLCIGGRSKAGNEPVSDFCGRRRSGGCQSGRGYSCRRKKSREIKRNRYSEYEMDGIGRWQNLVLDKICD